MNATPQPVELTENNLSTVDEDGMPDIKDVEAAVRVLIRWTGDNPRREGLLDTPSRVARSYREFFGGYGEDPSLILERTFEETSGYDEMVLLKDIRVESHCEHHMVPIVGVAHIAYLPRNRVVGISKIARVVDVFAKRLQIQERMTTDIADVLQNVLDPLGVAVMIRAEHHCMTTRGVQKPGVGMVTTRLLGRFRSDPETRREFLSAVEN
jgi:GTP cyclohydrolase I